MFVNKRFLKEGYGGLMKQIKERLKVLIQDNGGNQAKIARQIGVDPAQIGSIFSEEKRGLSATIIIGLANEGYDVQWLLTGESNRNRITELETELGDANRLIDSLERILKGGR